MRVKNIYWLMIALTFMMVVCVGCGDGKAEEPISPTEEPISVIEEPINPDDLRSTFIFEGEERDYLLYLPDAYSTEVSLPLVIVLHSYGWKAKIAMWNTDFNEVAEKYGFVIVYPNATPNWNSGIGDNPSYPTPDSDDVAFIKALITEMRELYHIDLERVYATGYSNGGFMAYRLACEASDQIAAIASVGGAMPESVFDNCKPKRAVSVLEMHGTKDTTVQYNGRPGWKSMEEAIDFWSSNNACESVETQTMADIDPEDESTIEKISHTNCKDGSSVILMKVENGGHTWPGEDDSAYGRVNKDIDASAEIWKFFEQYQLAP